LRRGGERKGMGNRERSKQRTVDSGQQRECGKREKRRAESEEKGERKQSPF